MKICPRCKSQSWNENKNICRECNTITKKTCPKCADKSLQNGICLNCGYEKTKKICKNCYWFNPIHFFVNSLGQWHSCLLPNKDRKRGIRESTRADDIICNYFKKEVREKKCFGQ